MQLLFRGDSWGLRVAIGLLLVIFPLARELGASVRLELRPPSQTVQIASTVQIGLYAIADGGPSEPVGQIRAVIEYSPSFLRLTGVLNNGPFSWSSSGFPDDSAADGLNNSLMDGDALYQARAPILAPASATPSGLLVATFQFAAVGTAAGTPVDIAMQIGSTTTEVLDDVPPLGDNVTGALIGSVVFIECSSSAQCSDGNPCTDDVCSAPSCSNLADDSNNPDDGLYCNGDEDFCLAGTIIYTTPPPDCNDGLACTQDSCNESQNQCDNVILANRCLIGGVCYVVASLNPINDCQACNPFATQTAWSDRPPGGSCGDTAETDCDHMDTCDGFGVCLEHLEPDGVSCSDDGNHCTLNLCSGGLCSHPPGPGGIACGDPASTTCSGPDACDAVGGCQPNHAPDGTSCDDGLFCTPVSSCSSGACAGSTTTCPQQVCDENAESCKDVELAFSPTIQSAVVGSTVDLLLIAQSGIGSDQPFSSAQVVLSWDPMILALVGKFDVGPYSWITSNFPNDCMLDSLNLPCSGLPFNDGDALYLAVGQFSPSPPAVATISGLLVTSFRFQTLSPGLTIVEVLPSAGNFTDSQVNDAETAGLDILTSTFAGQVNVLECVANVHCNDGDFCSGVEFCLGNECQPGSYPCGSQLCKESTDQCVDCLSFVDCDNGAFCDGVESCSAGGTCEAGSDPCPTSVCDEGIDECVECLTAIDCDDGFLCTTESCVAANCEFTVNHDSCNDGQFCTGSELCMVGSGCVSSGNPCPAPVTCEESTLSCGGCFPPTASGEGSRYLSVTPPAGIDPVALIVIGAVDDPEVSCVQHYVQADGTVGVNPVFQAPALWGTAHVRGVEIRPDSRYRLHTDCGTELNPLLSIGSAAESWVYGDVDDSHSVDLDDLLLVLDGFAGFFGLANLEAVDLASCIPGGIIDVDDILDSIDAFAGRQFSCERVCFGSCTDTGVSALGSRFVTVFAADWPNPYAISIQPDCPSGGVHYATTPTGPLNIATTTTAIEQAAFFTAAQWGPVVYITGAAIGPSTLYQVALECGTAKSPSPGVAQPALTWSWGDTDNSTTVDVDDLICVLEVFAGNFIFCSVYVAESMSCEEPNGVVDVDDLLAVLSGFAEESPFCPGSCP